jgi:hypothetical protein
VADSLVNVTLALHEPPATVADRLLAPSGSAHTTDALNRLARELGGVHAKDAKVLVRVDSVTRGASTATVVCDVSNMAEDDVLNVYIPGRANPVVITVVATTPDAAAGEIAEDAASDTASGAELVAVFKRHPVLNKLFSASNASGTVTLTALELGTRLDGVKLEKVVGTAGAFTITQFTGGDDILDQPSMTVTFGSANIAADDTISIGRRKYTWKAEASEDGEITLSTTEATAAENFKVAVNADTTWAGLIAATRADAVVTLTWLGDPRIGQHIVMDYAETNATSVVLGGTLIVGTGEAFVPGTALTGSSTTRTHGRGAA